MLQLDLRKYKVAISRLKAVYPQTRSDVSEHDKVGVLHGLALHGQGCASELLDVSEGKSETCSTSACNRKFFKTFSRSKDL